MSVSPLLPFPKKRFLAAGAGAGASGGCAATGSVPARQSPAGAKADLAVFCAGVLAPKDGWTSRERGLAHRLSGEVCLTIELKGWEALPCVISSLADLCLLRQLDVREGM